MPTFAEVTDPLLATYMVVPSAAAGICDLCHRPPNPGFTRCYSCDLTAGQVRRPVELVVPISLYTVGGQLHHSLRSYKDSPNATVRARFMTEVAALFGRFITKHGDCIVDAAGPGWEAIVPVPSGHGRPAVHPLVQSLALITDLPWPVRDVLRPTGTAILHQSAGDDAYEVAEDVAGLRVLLVDDTWTTGACMQSAASALSLAGAQVIAAVPIGRVFDATFNDDSRELHQRLRRTPFSFDTCCLE